MYFINTLKRHRNMSVKYTFKLVSNWCRAKLYDLSEKTVVPQYHSLTCIFSVKTMYFPLPICEKLYAENNEISLRKCIFYHCEKPVFSHRNYKRIQLKIPRFHPEFTHNVLIFSVVYSCLNSCQLSIKTRYFLMA